MDDLRRAHDGGAGFPLEEEPDPGDIGLAVTGYRNLYRYCSSSARRRSAPAEPYPGMGVRRLRADFAPNV